MKEKTRDQKKDQDKNREMERMEDKKRNEICGCTMKTENWKQNEHKEKKEF